jgi:3-oxoacyl-(acyl-carrier-protein) synthase
MSIRIAGLGWITPLGAGISEVWDCLLRGQKATAETVCNPLGGRPYSVYRVPDTALTGLPRHPRLRRASAISRFAAGAGIAALDDAGLAVPLNNAKKIALVFAVANGGVIYTRRFYDDIVKSGADAASPLLFPETVFNAAASHLAAIMGVTGASYTVVADGAVGLLALKMAEDLLAQNDLEYCLVVGAEEADWLLCDAYQKWRLLRSAPPIEVFGHSARGTLLSEGAGAILLGREGPVEVEAITIAAPFPRRRVASQKLKEVLRSIAAPEIAAVIASANGTFIDRAELEALANTVPQVPAYTLKPALGESVAAGGLWQVIVGAQVLRTKRLPGPQLNCPPLSSPPDFLSVPAARRTVVTSCGLNQQVAAIRLSV